eukprot:1241162-Rhodomonas_salina.1
MHRSITAHLAVILALKALRPVVSGLQRVLSRALHRLQVLADVPDQHRLVPALAADKRPERMLVGPERKLDQAVLVGDPELLEHLGVPAREQDLRVAAALPLGARQQLLA